MPTPLMRKAGLAAVILLAPGGFVLGATLLVRHYRRRCDTIVAEQDAPDDR